MTAIKHVPEEHYREVAGFSKDVLMDIAWNFAIETTGSVNSGRIMRELRKRAHAVNRHRRPAPPHQAEEEVNP